MVNCQISCQNLQIHDGFFEGLLATGNDTIQQNETNKTVPYNLYLLTDYSSPIYNGKQCNISCRLIEERLPDCVTNTVTFWSFVLLMSLGTIGFNVANCVSDATCFDMLGKLQLKSNRARSKC